MRAVTVITDLTRMRDQRVCLAGYLEDGTCVRPVFQFGGLMESWLYLDGQSVIRPFSKVEFDFHEQVGHPPHTEDWTVDPGYRVSRGMLTSDQARRFLDALTHGGVEAIFGASVYHDNGYYIRNGEGMRSLGTIRVAFLSDIVYLERDTGKWDYRLAFTDETGRVFNLAVTDLAFRYFLDNQRQAEKASPNEIASDLTASLRQSSVYLRVGLARGWSQFPERCYVQVTGVYSFPDYLDGRCFADFEMAEGKSGRPRRFLELPF